MTLLDSVGVSTVYSHKFYTSPIMHLICPPKFCISMVFNIFSWEGGNNSRNEKQRLYRILGGNLRYIIEDVQVANRPVSKYQNSYLALRLRGTQP